VSGVGNSYSYIRRETVRNYNLITTVRGGLGGHM
jgi:hypothetical protein